MYLSEVSQEEVLDVVKCFKAKKSSAFLGINMHLFRNIVHDVVYPLTNLCNKSFNQGVFSDQMKIAKVIPLFKNGDKSVFTNYRPVSLLPQFLKILEKLYSIRLDSFIDKHSILNDSQYGFRKSNLGLLPMP